jgi:hypothetical protein
MSAVARAAQAWSRGYRTVLGLDGSTVDEAVEAALTPTGPPREELRRRLIARRAA